MASRQEELKSVDIEKIIDKKRLELKSIESIEEEDAVNKGEHYSSEMRRLTIKGLHENGSTVTKSLVMKKGKDQAGGADFQKSIFSAEIKIYTVVLPEMKKIIDEANSTGRTVKIETLWPLCYGHRPYDAIILEDLKECGYKMRNRREPMGGDTAIFVVSQLAKFHALSITAIKRKLINPLDLSPNLFAINLPLVNNIWSGGLTLLADSLTSHPQWNCVVPKLREIATTCGDRVQEIRKEINKESNFMVICHGDCWTNNCLFKFPEDGSIPNSMKFVDYQVTNYGCFAWDLIYILNTSMSAKDKQSCYKSFVESYRRNLVETLEALEQDTTQVPKLDTMFTMMDKLNLFALIIAFTFFPLTINTMDEAWQVEKAMGNTQDTHCPEMYENPKFKESLYLDLVTFKSQGLL